MAKKLYGTDPDQVPTNADLGSAAYTDVNAMPNIVIGEPQEGIRFVDTSDNYALRINGSDYYSSGMKLSRTGTHAYTGTVQFEKIRTDASGNVVDGKSNDQIMQLYSNATNDAGEFVSTSSIIGRLLADIGSGTTSSGRLEFRPDGGSGAGVVVSIDADGLKFNGDTAAANALDDYEQGTWTPVYSGSSVTGAGTYTRQQGVYVKVGDLVYASCTIGISAHTGSGSAVVTGLPYAANSSTGNYAAISVSFNSGHTTTSGYQIIGFVQVNTAEIKLWETGGTGQQNALALDTSFSELDFSIVYRTT